MKNPTYLLGIAIVLIAFPGCGSLLSFVKKAPPPAPPPVRETPQHIELKRRALRFSDDVLLNVHRAGAPPEAPLVWQGHEALRGLAATEGEPARPIPGPLDLAAGNPAAKAMLAELSDYNEGYLDATARWWAKYEQYRGTPVKTGWTVGSGALKWLIGGAIALVTLMAFGGLKFVTLGRALRQVVAGVQGFLTKNPASVGAGALKTELRSGMDAASKSTVDKIKRRLGM